MAALFSTLAIACAADAAFVACILGRPAVPLDRARRVASGARVILFCGALCLIAARFAR